MAEVEGKLLTCDLCGATVFLKYIETKDYDGGFTHVRRYEGRPEGWQTWHIDDIVNSTLCPSCDKKMNEALLRCISEIRGETDHDA